MLYLPAYAYEDGQYACISINLEADPDAWQRPFVLACQDGRDAVRLAHSVAVREMIEGSEASLLEPYIVDASADDAREMAEEAGAVGTQSCTSCSKEVHHSMYRRVGAAKWAGAG